MARTTSDRTDTRELKTTTITDPATNAAVTTAILDQFSGVIITTTTTGNAQTLQDPTNTTNINRFTVINDDDSTDPITVNGDSLPTGESRAFIWDGDDWTKEGVAVAGAVSGPVSSTDTAIAKWNGTGGDTLQDSAVLIDVSNNVTGVNDLTVGNDLTVSGTTTTINTTNLNIEDKNITLGNVTTPTDTTADGGGITLLGTTNKTITWDNATDNWTLNQNTTIIGDLTVDTTTLFVDSTNNRVGIGTITPIVELEVVGTPGSTVGGFASGALQVRSPSTLVNANSVITGHNSFGGNTQLWYLGSVSSSNQNIAVINRQNAALSLHTNNLARLTIEAGGNVGIGTAAPQGELEISAAASPEVIIRASTEVDTAIVDLTFATGSGATTSSNQIALIRADITQATPSTLKGDLVFFTNRGDSTTEAMRIDDVGNVGIGTSSPGNPLHVQGTGAAQSIMTNTFARFGNSGANDMFLGSDGTDIMIAPGNSGSKMHLLSRVGGVNSKALTVASDGNVGIGTDSPSSLLEVSNVTASSTAQIGLHGNRTAAGTIAQLLFSNVADSVAAIAVIRDGADDAGAFTFSTQPAAGSPLERMRITSVGNVGIGLSAPVANTTAGVIQVGLADATTVPTGTVTGGGIMYSTGGILHWLDTAGVDTDLTAGGAGAAVNRATTSFTFEATGRYNVGTISGGTSSFNVNGVQLSTSATGGSAKAIKPSMFRANAGDVFSGSPVFSAQFDMQTIGTTGSVYIGLGLPDIAAAGHDFTIDHIGFKVTISSSVATLFATQADGTTENASSALTTLTTSNVLDIIAVVNGTTSVDYYFRKDGGALSSATNLTSNLPSGTRNAMQTSIANDNTATNSVMNCNNMSFTR